MYQVEQSAISLRKNHLLDNGFEDKVHDGVVVAVVCLQAPLPIRDRLHRIR